MADLVTTLHGTAANALTAAAIHQTAISDLARKARNARRASERDTERRKYGNLPDAVREIIGRDEPYGFAKSHVSKAENPRQLLEQAICDAAAIRKEIEFWEFECSTIKDGEKKVACPYKPLTIMLYQDDARLAAALALCE